MASLNLKLFRRHEKSCTGDGKTGNPATGRIEAYDKEHRIYEEDTIRRNGKKVVVDCSCTMYADGTLHRNGVKSYLRPKSTGARTWEDAKAIRAKWILW